MSKYWKVHTKGKTRYAGSDNLKKKKADRKYYNKKESWEKNYKRK